MSPPIESEAGSDWPALRGGLDPSDVVNADLAILANHLEETIFTTAADDFATLGVAHISLD